MSNVSSSNSQKANVPKLRFPEFTDEWESTYLDKLLRFQNGINTSSDKYGSGIKFISVMDILNNSYITYENINGLIDITDDTLHNFSVNYGDILFQRSSETIEDVGKSNVYLDHRIATFGGFVIRGRKISDYDPLFLKYLLDSPIMRKHIIKLGQGAQHFNIGQENLKSIKLSMPKITEQEKIGSLFKLLDKKIEYQKEIINVFKSYKRGLLSSIFEQKICFNNKSIWMTNSLGFIFSERVERASGSEELLSVTIENGIQKRENIETKDNSSKNKSNYKKVYINDIAYNTMRMWQGASGHSLLNGIVSPAYTVIKLNDNKNHSIKFWAFYFKHKPLIKKFQKYSQGLTSDTWNLKYPQFARIQVNYPPYEDQIKIVNILESLDELISREEKTLEYIIDYKIQLLQKMFI